MPRAARTLAVACTTTVAALSLAVPASAHSDEGTMVAETRPAAEPSAVTARARVVFANDGHPGNEATVTVTGTGPGGAQVGPTTLTRVEEGEYEAVVALPAAGEWTLQFSSTNPSATAGATFTALSYESGPPTTGSAKRAPRTDNDDSSGLNASVFAIAGGAAAVVALVGGVFVVRRRR